ncbi:MAG: hypothetical protein AB7E70_09330 [Hyphomicrobiaceae bacterium]
MFLACMATSVFFSFDSLFAQIFPQDERKRAADIRAQNRVAGVVADIGALARKRRIEEAEALFTSKAWASYEGRLDGLVRLARQAPEEIQRHFEQRMREQQAQRARIQDDVAGAASQRVRLEKRRDTLRGDITRIKEQLPQLASETDRHKAALFQKEREITAMKAEVGGEAGGIGVTGKVGRGPKFRELQASLFRLNEEKKKIELQLRDWEQRLKSATEQVASSESELERLGGEIAKLKGREETGKRLIESARERQATVDAPRIDPTNMLAALEKARVEFRQKADAKGLATLQQVCSTMLGAIGQVPSLKDQSKAIDCDPGVASEAASRVFALNAGIVRYEQTCARGENLPSSGGTDALLTFAARCVQDSGLPGRDTAALRTTLNRIALDRDDKAHRFVVTWNAFDDGNKLAYLALAIAIAIDGLVFLSGLFGANAVRSPLSDVPSSKARSAKDLIAVIDNALLPERFDNAKLVLGAMSPITNVDGFMAEVLLGETHDRVSTVRIRHVLNAGATIGAVRRADGHEDRYLIRGELYEYLAQVCKREFERSDEHVKAAALEQVLMTALEPDIGRNAETVLHYMEPVTDPKSFFTSEIRMPSVRIEDRTVVLSALNAAATLLNMVGRNVEKDESITYYISPDFYRCLAKIKAKAEFLPRRHGPALSHDRPSGPLHGGRLSEPREAITQAPESRRIATDFHLDPAGRRPKPTEQPSADEKRLAEKPAKLDERFESEVIGYVLPQMGIGPTAYSEATESEAFLGGEKSVMGWLYTLDFEFGKALKGRYQEFETDFREAMAEQRRRFEGDAFQTAQLDMLESGLRARLSALFYGPRGPFERFITQAILHLRHQHGEGLLSEDHERVLRRLENLESALSRQRATDAFGWQRRLEIFQASGISAEDRQHLPEDAGKRTLN